MRLIFLTVLSAAGLYGQGGGGVQFRDLTPLGATGKPAMACTELRSLTSFDLSVISASVIVASASAPEHCRVQLDGPARGQHSSQFADRLEWPSLHVRQWRLGGRIV